LTAVVAAFSNSVASASESHVAQDRRSAVHHRLDRRVAARGNDLEEVGLAHVARRPLGHQERRVTLIDGCAGEHPVALVEDPVLVLEDREVLVLESVIVLVREVETLVRAGSAALGDDVELPLVAPIETGDATAQQVEREVAEVSGRRDETKRLVQPLVGGEVGRRGVLVELLGDQRPELRLVDELSLDRAARLQAADPDDLLLDRVVGRIGRRIGASRRCGGRG
jgi:hypothetical protein